MRRMVRERITLTFVRQYLWLQRLILPYNIRQWDPAASSSQSKWNAIQTKHYINTTFLGACRMQSHQPIVDFKVECRASQAGHNVAFLMETSLFIKSNKLFLGRIHRQHRALKYTKYAEHSLTGQDAHWLTECATTRKDRIDTSV